jgi:pimeloyl-ACP methyl ester carboxylesterase
MRAGAAIAVPLSTTADLEDEHMNIRSFEIKVSEVDLVTLRRRLEATRWPSVIENAGWQLGMDDGFLRRLIDYWRDQFDWRRQEKRLNGYAHYIAEDQGGSTHFVRFPGQGPAPLPIVLTHGWPSTFAEQLELAAMLANPVAYGGEPADAFEVIVPSLQGFAFSSAPTVFGTNLFTIAARWASLMTSLGFERFIAHGGDFGAGVTTALGLKHAARLYGVHLHYIPGSYRPPLDADKDLLAEERAFLGAAAEWADSEGAYAHVQRTKPDTLAYALNDSPVGLAAWIVEKFRSWSDCDGEIERRFSMDTLLTHVCLYWFTQSMPAAMRLYYENAHRPLHFAASDRVTIPVAVARFPREAPFPPRPYVERGYRVTRWTEMARGGHFAAAEEPALLAEDIRSFCRQFRDDP